MIELSSCCKEEVDYIESEPSCSLCRKFCEVIPFDDDGNEIDEDMKCDFNPSQPCKLCGECDDYEDTEDDGEEEGIKEGTDTDVIRLL